MLYFNKFHFTFIILLLALNITIFSLSLPIEPMRDVKPGWDVSPIYEISHPPGPKCIGENNDLYYIDNLNHFVMKMDEYGVHSEFASLTISLTDIRYQPNHNRLIGMDDFSFYIITSSGLSLLKNYSYGSPLTTMTVNPLDDSIYCGSILNGSDILKFDANGNFINSILSNVHGCSQLALNNNQSILYYAETYLGSFSMMNLTTSNMKVLRSGIGLPGTQEVIGIGLDDNDDLYYMTADGNNPGFYKYVNNSFIFLTASKGGMSTLTWSTKLKMFIAAGSAGGCLIGYYPDDSKSEFLTPIVNSHSLIETLGGNILYIIEDMIYEINSTGPTFFCKNPYNTTIRQLISDVDYNIYALLNNDSVAIVGVNLDGSFEDWFHNEIHEWAKSLHYDIKNYELILFTEDFLQNVTNIYRIPIASPLSYHKVTTIDSLRVVGVTDVHGNIFAYEACNNTLFKIPDGALGKEIITTDFVDFSDIYGGNVTVEPPLGYSTIENGIIIGRNDDLQMWLLDENIRITFAINNRGIDNSAIYQTFNKEIICTQSTLVLKFIYQGPNSPNIPGPYYSYFFTILLGIIIAILIHKIRNNKMN